MKFNVAIIHDVFIEHGGAERVLLALLHLFPDADVYVPLLNEDGRAALKKNTTGQIYTSIFNNIPFISSASLLLKPFLYLYWENLDLKKYNLVISSSHSFSSKSVITSPTCLHISYIHTPPRYLYTEYNETQLLRSPFFKILFSPVLSWLRVYDFIGAQRPDILIANSKVVQKRIQKYYRRESQVIYPPVLYRATKEELHVSKTKKYFVCFSRLAKQKGIELAIQTCNELKLPLLVVGKGHEEKNLKSLAGPTITFAGFVPDEKMSRIFSNAFALINCAKEEDFGLVNVEALYWGVPVIGYNSGGTAEVITPTTGILFNDFSVDSLKSVIAQFKKKNFSPAECKKRARQFSEHIFQKKFKDILERAREIN